MQTYSVDQKQIKKKRIMTGVACVAVLLVFCGVLFSFGLKKNTSYADGETKVTRGVVGGIKQLPQYGISDYTSLEVGTVDRPFVVLEVVPNPEYAEFGFLISGCEPVAVEDMFGRGALSTVNSTKDNILIQRQACFFGEEKQGNAGAYDSAPNKETTGSLNGYYELVEAGTGNFKRVITVDESGSVTGVSFVAASGEEANLIWHSVNDFEMGYQTYSSSTAVYYDDRYMIDSANTSIKYINYHYDAASLTFSDPLDKELSAIGDRIFTTRAVSEEDPCYRFYCYYEYYNYDYFLQNTLSVPADKMDDYCIVTKTITPEELNANLEWIQYSDLITVSPKNHISNMNEIVKQYGRPELGYDSGRSVYTDGFITNDLSWEAALAIYNKASAEEDYAAVILDDTVYNPSSYLAGGKSISLDVYDWNLKKTGQKYTTTGYNNNVYKLCVMLLSMDYDLFKNLYLSSDEEGKTPFVSAGKDTLQSGDAQEYWAFETFLLIPSWEYIAEYFSSTIYGYWSSDLVWKKYGMTAQITTYKYYVRNRVYSYTGDTSIAQDYITAKTSGCWGESSKYADYVEYLKDEDMLGKAGSAEAVRYILGMEKEPGEKDTKDLTLRILDIEPSVSVSYVEKTDSHSYAEAGCQPMWTLQESYIRMLYPAYKGKVEITHMTTAEFNGKAEDINSTYQMVFIGTDFGGYNTRSQTIRLRSGKYVTMELPDWNDSLLDGKIYLHSGDFLNSTEMQNSGKKRNRSVNFLYNIVDASKGTQLRFGGNDITSIKMKELEDFAASGYPIVVSDYLYNRETAILDTHSYIYELMDKLVADPSTNIYNSVGESKKTGGISVKEAIESVLAEDVTFHTLPTKYDGSTDGDTAVFTDPHYLPKNASGRACLDFVFDVKESGYSYRIYIDADGNSKFSDEEVVYSSSANKGTNSKKYLLAKDLIGLVQWQIEVYQKDNPAVRFVESGCSAIKNDSGIRKEINVLQIMPSSTSEYKGKLNLSTSELFGKYIAGVTDYRISITSITAQTFASYFEGSGFSFDISEDISDSNPVHLDEVGRTMGVDLSKYNMIVVGFGDAYGTEDLDNTNGAVDYLSYYIAKGGGILFTHDVTSMYNLQYPGASSSVFGSTVNKLLRDQLGMNANGMVSNQLDTAHRNAIIAYQAAKTDNYTTLYDTESKQGFTYYAMKRLGWLNTSHSGLSGISDANYRNSGNYNRMLYKYMITNPLGEALCKYTNADKYTGLNNNNDLTREATKLNEGQITEYPYKISDSLSIAKTHGQWYQLAMEDEDVTVWYTLDDDGVASAWQATDNSGDGSAITYGVSPKDAANNYYIYSKGNVFYSGVGHSTVTGNEEAKLFVNTMIAAYRASYEPPVVDVTNTEAYLTSNQTFSIEIMQTFDTLNSGEAGYDSAYAGENQQVSENFDTEKYRVFFTPTEYNMKATRLECTIAFKLDSGTTRYLDEFGIRIYDKENDALAIYVDPATHKYVLENGHEYFFDYPQKYLDAWSDPAVDGGAEQPQMRNIVFSVNNDLVSDTNITNLHMSVEPLFQLD